MCLTHSLIIYLRPYQILLPMSVKNLTISIVTKRISICQEEKKRLNSISNCNRVYPIVIIVDKPSSKLLLQFFYITGPGYPRVLSKIKIFRLCWTLHYASSRYNCWGSTYNSSRMVPVVLFTECACQSAIKYYVYIIDCFFFYR